MANSRRNYICITETGKVKKYASQSIGQIIDEKEDHQDPFISITSIGVNDGIALFDWEKEFKPLD